MKKNIISLLFAVCLLFFASCKDNGGGSTPPPSKLDKIIFTQTTGGGDYVAMTLGKEDEINVTTEPTPGMPAPPPDKRKFFATSLSDNTTVQLTPELTDDQTSNILGLAPNGDLWLGLDQGILISNVNSKNPRPQMILPAQKMAKDFVDNSEEGVYKIADIPTGIKYISNKEQKDYWAFVPYKVKRETKSSNWKFSTVIKYDSKENSFEPLLPFTMNPTLYYSNTKPEGDHVSCGQPYNINPGQFKNDGFYYMLNIWREGKENNYLVQYNPSEDKHYLELSFSGNTAIPLTNCSFEKGTCRIAEYKNVHMTPLDCGKATKEEAAECINKKLAENKIGVYDVKMMHKEISLQSKEDAFKLLEIAAPEQKQIVSIAWTALYKVSTDEIFCNQSSCYFPVSFSGANEIYFSADPKRIGKDWIFFVTYNSKGNNRFLAINYATGAVTLLDETLNGGDFISMLGFADDHWVYAKKNDEKKQIFVYSPKNAKPIEILTGDKKLDKAETPYFTEKTDAGEFYSNSITHDGSKIFLKVDGKQYYVNTSEIVEGKEAKLNPAVTTDVADADFQLQLLWKGYALWKDSKNLYINKPFDADKSAKPLMAAETGKWASFSAAGTVAEFAPPPDIGFDISADFGTLFKCGAGGDYALWCEGSSEMCESGKCVDKLACKTNDECPEGSICQGHCTSGIIVDPVKPVEPKQCDSSGPCNEKFGCSIDGMCIPEMGAITVNVDKTPIYSASSVDYKAVVSWEKVSDYEGNVIDSYIVAGGTAGKKEMKGNSTEMTFSVPGAKKQMGFSAKVVPVIEGLADADKAKIEASSNIILLENKDHCMLGGSRGGKCPEGFKCVNKVCKSPILPAYDDSKH